MYIVDTHTSLQTLSLGLENGREKSGNFEQTGKVNENHTEYWNTQNFG